MNAIDPRAKLGKNIQLGNFCTIGPDVEIGDGVCIGNNVTIHSGTKIGNGVRIDDKQYWQMPMRAVTNCF